MRRLFFITIIFLLGCSISGMKEYNEGVEAQQAGKVDLAEQDFKLAIQKNPEFAEAYVNLGKIYLERGWLDGCEEQCKKAIDVASRTKNSYEKGGSWQRVASLGHSNLGVVYLSRAIESEARLDVDGVRKNLALGKENLTKAVELDPSNSHAQATLQKVKLLLP